MGTIDTPEKFAAERLRLAQNEWTRMKANNSQECRNCHNYEYLTTRVQGRRSNQMHQAGFAEGKTCIDCHKGIAHRCRRSTSTSGAARRRRPRGDAPAGEEGLSPPRPAPRHAASSGVPRGVFSGCAGMAHPGRLCSNPSPCSKSKVRLPERRSPVVPRPRLPPPGGGLLRVAGPNGVGKTSLLRLVTGLALPEAGEIRWRGESIRRAREAFHGDLLYLGHAAALNDLLSPLENLRFACAAAGDAVDEEDCVQALQRIGLADQLDLLAARAVAGPAPPRGPGAAVPVERAPAVGARRTLHRARRARSPISPPRCRSTATRAAW